MKKETFIETVEKEDNLFNLGDFTRFTERLIKDESRLSGKKGNRQIVCAIEELSELQKALTKQLRGMDSKSDILEEMADVYITMFTLRLMLGFDDEIVQKVMYKKIRRAEKELNRCAKTGEKYL